MNFVITHKCNKNCNFCFAKEKSSCDEILLDDFEFLIKNSESRIRLLGGEPTQSLHFEEILSLCSSYNKQVCLISNLLFNDQTLSLIKDYINNNVITNVLSNASYLDVNDRFEVFRKNFRSIYSLLSRKVLSMNISLGLTIEKDVDEEYYINYYNWLLENIHFRRLRISLDYPASNSIKNPEKYINDKKTGSILYKIWKMSNEKQILFAGDCNIYPCMFEKEIYSEMKNNPNVDIFSSCLSGAIDIEPDMNVNYCFPLKGIVSLDLKDQDINGLNEKNISNYINNEYNRIFKNNIKNIPSICRSCDYFQNQECEGPCLGLLLSKEKEYDAKTI